MASVTPEGKIKAKIDKLLKAYKVWYYSPQAGPHGQSGIPDRVACVRGRFVGIEAKANKTCKPTAMQIMQGRNIVNAGGLWFLVYDGATLAELEDYLNHACYQREEASDLEVGFSPTSVGEHPIG